MKMIRILRKKQTFFEPWKLPKYFDWRLQLHAQENYL